MPIFSENRLLAVMSGSDRAHLSRFLEPVDLCYRQNLARRRYAIEHVYFIDLGMVSVVAKAKGDNVAEVAVIGSEGAAGCGVILEADVSCQDVYMQVPGRGRRIEVAPLMEAMASRPELRRVLLRYVHSLIALQDETAVSAARGTIRQRLARWLLLAQDRLGREINLTHDFLGVMLGVRRAGVTNALGAFCEEGLIEASRGRITIIDRDHLLVAAAGFYGSARSEYDRLFSRHL